MNSQKIDEMISQVADSELREFVQQHETAKSDKPTRKGQPAPVRGIPSWLLPILFDQIVPELIDRIKKYLESKVGKSAVPTGDDDTGEHPTPAAADPGDGKTPEGGKYKGRTPTKKAADEKTTDD